MRLLPPYGFGGELAHMRCAGALLRYSVPGSALLPSPGLTAGSRSYPALCCVRFLSGYPARVELVQQRHVIAVSRRSPVVSSGGDVRVRFPPPGASGRCGAAAGPDSSAGPYRPAPCSGLCADWSKSQPLTVVHPPCAGACALGQGSLSDVPSHAGHAIDPPLWRVCVHLGPERDLSTADVGLHADPDAGIWLKVR